MLLRFLQVVEKSVFGGGAEAQLVDDCFDGRQVKILRHGLLGQTLRSGIEMLNSNQTRNQFQLKEIVECVLRRIGSNCDEAFC